MLARSEREAVATAGPLGLLRVVVLCPRRATLPISRAALSKVSSGNISLGMGAS